MKVFFFYLSYMWCYFTLYLADGDELGFVTWIYCATIPALLLTFSISLSAMFIYSHIKTIISARSVSFPLETV